MRNRKQRKTRNLFKAPHHQHGQSLIEFLILALVLIPLFLLVPVIGKYQDISHATSMASRYTLFAAETRGRSLDTPLRRQFLVDNIRRRFFSRTDAPVKTNDVAGNFEADQHPLWKDPQHRPLIKDFSDVEIHFGAAPSKRDFEASEDGNPFLLKKELALEARGVYTVNVDVKLANLPKGLRFYEPFNHLNLSIHKQASALLNPWTGWSPTNINNHLEDSHLIPTQELKALTPLTDLAVSAIELPGAATGSPITGPKFGQLKLWDDIIPQDRLKAGSVPDTSKDNASPDTPDAEQP